MPFDSIVSRNTPTDPLVPQPVSAQIIQEMATQSVLLQRARRVALSTNTQRLPVIDVLPQAYWVSGDTGLKQTTAMEWKGIDLIVEELAAIVPIPENYLADTQVPLWNEIRPRLVEALGAKLDAAALFGVDKPSTWGNSIYLGAVAAGNGVIVSSTDPTVGVATLGERLALDGYAANAFAARPGFGWRLVGLRTTEGIPLYQPNLQGTPGGSLYGYPVSEVNNGSWDATEAELIAGDWTKAIVGMRQDITFKMFTEGVISDSSGNVVLNLMQQDAVAMRVVMRVAYAVANPASRLAPTEAGRFPFAVLQATTANS